MAPQRVYVSATPSRYEEEHQDNLVELIVRPTGLTDPDVEVRPASTQIDDVIGECNERVALKERVLITTLTKKNGRGFNRLFKWKMGFLQIYAFRY